MKIVLVTPPMTQINTPYSAIPHLAGFLRVRGIESTQIDLSLELFLAIFSHDGFLKCVQASESARARTFFAAAAPWVESIVAFLQGQRPELAMRITRGELPVGPRMKDALSNPTFEAALGTASVQDRARFLASTFIDDAVDCIAKEIDPEFRLSRYGEKLAASQPDFSVIEKQLRLKTTITEILDGLIDRWILSEPPDVLGLTVPFPGNLLGALRIADRVRKKSPKTKIVLGGGYVNTELRSLSDPRIFDRIDAITFDAGELPFLRILENGPMVRTRIREGGQVRYVSDPSAKDPVYTDRMRPSYEGVDFKRYPALVEMLNPAHRLWSEFAWVKLAVAHGCYWRRCTFCDLSLSYIRDYQPGKVSTIIDTIEVLIKETGQRGFHFVDEAAPPQILRHLAQAILDRGIKITWWANIRFEKSFTRELCQLLARSGCVMVSGGLEVASDRVLKRINKGVTLPQVRRVTAAFRDAGVMVHAYLMYGFPGQTRKETIESLAFVRDLFATNRIQSGFWHRFSATAHSPIGQNPKDFGITLVRKKVRGHPFGENDLEFRDPSGVDHARLGKGLNRALYNYLWGVGLDRPVQEWFS